MQAPSRASASGTAHDPAPPGKRQRVSMVPNVHVPGRAGAPSGADAPIPHQIQAAVANRSAPTGPSSGAVPRNTPATTSANQYTPNECTEGRGGPPTAGAGESMGAPRASSSSAAGSTNTNRRTARSVAGRSGSAAAAAAVSSTDTSQRSYATENFNCDFLVAASERARTMAAAEGSRPSALRGRSDPEPAAATAAASARESNASAAPDSGGKAEPATATAAASAGSGRSAPSTGSGSTKKEPKQGKSMRVNLVSLFTSSVPSAGGSSGKRGRKTAYFCFDFSNSGDCSRGSSCPYPHVG